MRTTQPLTEEATQRKVVRAHHGRRLRPVSRQLQHDTRACSIDQQATLRPFMPGYLGQSLTKIYDIVTSGDSKKPQKLFNWRRNAFPIGLPTRSQTISSTVAGLICKRAEPPLALNRNHGPRRECCCEIYCCLQALTDVVTDATSEPRRLHRS
jgi:hypothetical protein